MSYNHGKVFTISDANQLEINRIIPKRNELLDPIMVANTNKLIDTNREILFLGNDVAQSIQKNQYELILHGITTCGSKTTITIKGIFPFVDLDTTTRTGTASEQIIRLKNKLNHLNMDFKRIDIVRGKNFMKYHKEEREYIRVYFDTLKSRLDFISMCIKNNIKSYNNDQSAYYRVVARNYKINLSGWNKITSYVQNWNGKYKSNFVLDININDISSFDPDQDNKNLAYPINLFKYENAILAGFDIEMIPFHKNTFPDAEKCSKDSIFMICITFHFAKKEESILSIILTLKENDPLEDVISIVCDSEYCLLLAFSKVFDMIQPEFITEFNGGGFDWRNIIVKSQYFGIIPFFLSNMAINHMMEWEKNLNRYYFEKEVKIGGSTAPSKIKSLKMQGYINFDTLCVFKQLDPTENSHKLNDCLERCNLGSKDNMDIQEMFNIYKNGTITEMKMVAHYCYIDTVKLQALLLKRNVIQDRREVSLLSMVSIYDTFYYANGGRIRNILMSVGEELGYKFDTTYKPTIDDEKAKFPGAFVVPPIKGIVRPIMSYKEFLLENNISFSDSIIDIGYQYIEKHYDSIIDKQFDTSAAPEEIKAYIEYMLSNEIQYPISGLDFSSLYPSLIMTYNISPETLITDRNFAEQMMRDGYKIHYVSFPFLNKTVDAWFVQHENNETLYGLCPRILIELFAKRAQLKKILKPISDKKLHMEMDMKKYSKNEYPYMDEYNEVCFDYNYLDSKQKALKIFMNTFYGEMGNFLSFICAVETAASVTTMGQYNLKLAKSFVENQLGMKTYYGDSVVGETPIMIRQNNMINIVAIENLNWHIKDIIYTNSGKELIIDNDNIEVYSDIGWTKIKQCIRHKTNKKMYQITTALGSITVSEDHSLLDTNKQKIKPTDCYIGTNLLHWNSLDLNQSEIDMISTIWYDTPNTESNYSNLVDEQKAYIYNTQILKNTNLLVDNSYAITSIKDIGYCEDYIYDLETESHHFAAGVGQLVVHNTDSLYITCNKKHFSDMNKSYYTGKTSKLEYCTGLVNKTFELIEIAKVEVNNHLYNDNGTKFLKMAYEEVLFPVVFVSKKKYFGIQHEEIVNFKPKKPFLRGLEIIKRGASNVLKDICGQIVDEILDINTTCDMLSLVHKATKRYFTTQWDISNFVKTAVYRPNRQNISVHKFINRYTNDNYPQIPEPNVRFKYIIGKKYLWTYDTKGRQTILSIGDRIELIDRAIAENIPVDLEYYFNNEITGQMARFIAFHDEFDTIDRNKIDDTLTDKKRYTKIEESMFKNAKKYIIELGKEYSDPFVNKRDLFKQTYKIVANIIRPKDSRTKKVVSLYPNNVKKAISILEDYDYDTSLQNLRNKIQAYICNKYNIENFLTNLDVQLLFDYIQTNDLSKYLKDCSENWIANIVDYVRLEYNYDQLCQDADSVETPYDLFTKDQIVDICNMPELYVGLPESGAKKILEMIDVIISKYI